MSQILNKFYSCFAIRIYLLLIIFLLTGSGQIYAHDRIRQLQQSHKVSTSTEAAAPCTTSLRAARRAEKQKLEAEALRLKAESILLNATEEENWPLFQETMIKFDLSLIAREAYPLRALARHNQWEIIKTWAANADPADILTLLSHAIGTRRLKDSLVKDLSTSQRHNVVQALFDVHPIARQAVIFAHLTAGTAESFQQWHHKLPEGESHLEFNYKIQSIGERWLIEKASTQAVLSELYPCIRNFEIRRLFETVTAPLRDSSPQKSQDSGHQ